MKTLEKSRQSDSEQMELSVTSSPPDFHAKIYQSPESNQELTERAAAYGQSALEFLGKFDHVTQSLKTSQRCLVETMGDGFSEYSGTFPRSGMMQNGTVYRLETLCPLRRERPTNGIGSGLFATPTEKANMWQTLVSDDAVNRTKGKYNNRGEPKLSAQVKMYPTPTTRDHKDGSAKSCANVPANGLLGRVAVEGTESGSLNPQFVEWLMGYPMDYTRVELLPESKTGLADSKHLATQSFRKSRKR